MKALDRAAILAAPDLTVLPVVVPAWGDGAGVHVRVMSGRERDALEALSLKHRGADGKGSIPDFRAVIVALCACDAAGVRLFAIEDVPAIAAKSNLALEPIAEAALTLNRLTSGEVKALVGESAGGPSAASGSA